jgi:Ca2+-binding RTX toxin-like protein
LSRKPLQHLLPALVVLAALALAPSAFAATVSKTGGQMSWTAADNIHNQLQVSQVDDPSDPGVSLYDSSGDTITLAGDTETQNDCVADGSQVTCHHVSGFTGNSQDLSDYVNASELQTIPATLNGGDGGDWLTGGMANDTINGGLGDDGPNGFFGDSVGGDGICFYCYEPGLYGGGGSDTINGDAGSDAIFGGAGDIFCECTGGDAGDTINGGDGNDFIDGEQGDDHIDAGPGNDGSTNSGCNGCGLSNVVTPNLCCYVLTGVYGGDGNDTMTGGDGVDEVAGGPGNDVVDGGNGDDYVAGDDAGSFCDGGCSNTTGGNDTVSGGSGNDYLEGEYGSDTVNGGDGSDYINEWVDGAVDDVHGGAGIDNMEYDTCTGSDEQIPVTLDDQANDGQTNDDPVNNFHSDVDNAIVYTCGETPAKMVGSDGPNYLQGDDGADNIDGGLGPDRLVGQAGNDTFNSRDGYPDYVDCGTGIDSVTADQFDTFEACENVDVGNVRSAYDSPDAPQPQAPPQPPADHHGPGTKLGGPRTLTIDQFLNGFNISVSCDESCKIQSRLLASQPAGDVKLAKNNGFNLVLGRKTVGFANGTRKIRMRPCEPIRSHVRKTQCLARMKRSAERKGHFQIKVHVVTTDHLGNRTETTRLITVRKSRH